MKTKEKFILFVLAVAAVVAMSGCTSMKQAARHGITTTSPAGVVTNEYWEVTGNLTASGNSAQEIGNMKASASGKTAGIGITDVSQQNDLSGAINSIGNLLINAFKAGMMAAPSPQPVLTLDK